MSFRVERIVVRDDINFIERNGSIDFDEACPLIPDCQDDGPLVVASGLEAHDVAVVLSVPIRMTERQRRMTEIGYWVTHIDPDMDGAGILVSMDLVASNRFKYGSDRVNAALHALQMSGCSAADFGLASLKQFSGRPSTAP